MILSRTTDFVAKTGAGDAKSFDVVPDAHDKIVDELYEKDTGRSNFVAFLLGGVVVAGSMLAFLYYDSDSYLTRDALTTGSIGQSSTIKIVPSSPIQVPAPAAD